ncbi:MAG TPA: DUF1772 domain-containing protein [Chitinophagaceae bacterium]|nr:DUF1772 domain-containing protein [Chitinophagaceae bacterium]
MKKTIQIITGLLLVLVAGVFWGTWFSLSRTMDRLPPEIFIIIGKEIMQNVAVVMSIIMPASIVGLITLMVGSWKVRSVYFYCIIVSLILSAIALLITVGIEVPIDNQIKTWSKQTMPSNWQNIRGRWQWYHTIRTFSSLSAVILFLVAIIKQSPGYGIARNTDPPGSG